MKYHLYGLLVETSLEIPGLKPSKATTGPDVVLELLPRGNNPLWELAEENRSLFIAQRDGRTFVELYRLPSHYLMRCQEALDFWVSADGSLIRGYLRRDLPSDLVRLFALGWVFSLVIHLRGMGGLHASAVRVGDKAIGFAGSSGSGKSTLVTALALAGCPILTDEVVAIKRETGRLYVMPGYPEVRVAGETVPQLRSVFGSVPIASRPDFDKVALRPDGSWARNCREPLPLGALYILTQEDPLHHEEICIQTLPPKAAPRELLRHSFRIPMSYREILASQFALLCDLCEQVPVRRLIYLREIGLLSKVVRSILELEAKSAPENMNGAPPRDFHPTEASPSLERSPGLLRA